MSCPTYVPSVRLVTREQRTSRVRNRQEFGCYRKFAGLDRTNSGPFLSGFRRNLAERIIRPEESLSSQLKKDIL